MLQRKSVAVPASAVAASSQSQASVASTVNSTASTTAAAAAPAVATAATAAAVAVQEPQDDAPLGSRTGSNERIRPGTVGASIRLNVLQLLSPPAKNGAARTVQVRTASLCIEYINERLQCT
jgi:hypothetical protein